jgi:hypothetical protein
MTSKPTMTKEEFRQARLHIGATQNGKNGIGRVIGIADRTARAYEAGDRPIPKTVERFLRILVLANIPAHRIVEELDKP